MQLSFKGNLPFVKVVISYQGQPLEIKNVLVDTGSATTLFATDVISAIQIFPLPDDELKVIRGVGSIETVFSRKIDFLQVGKCQLSEFEIEVGGMDYGFDINGILGTNFLIGAGAIINLRQMRIELSDV